MKNKEHARNQLFLYYLKINSYEDIRRKRTGRLPSQSERKPFHFEKTSRAGTQSQLGHEWTWYSRQKLAQEMKIVEDPNKQLVYEHKKGKQQVLNKRAALSEW